MNRLFPVILSAGVLLSSATAVLAAEAEETAAR